MLRLSVVVMICNRYWSGPSVADHGRWRMQDVDIRIFAFRFTTQSRGPRTTGDLNERTGFRIVEQ